MNPISYGGGYSIPAYNRASGPMPRRWPRSRQSVPVLGPAITSTLIQLQLAPRAQSPPTARSSASSPDIVIRLVPARAPGTTGFPTFTNF